VRLRERKIGPYKYPTIDRTKGEETQNKEQSKDRVKKNRVKQSIQNLHRERNQLCRCLHPCRKRPKNQYPQKPASSFSFPGKQKEKAKVTNSLPHHHQKQKAFEPTPVLQPSSPSPEKGRYYHPLNVLPKAGCIVDLCY